MRAALSAGSLLTFSIIAESEAITIHRHFRRIANRYAGKSTFAADFSRFGKPLHNCVYACHDYSM